MIYKLILLAAIAGVWLGFKELGRTGAIKALWVSEQVLRGEVRKEHATRAYIPAKKAARSAS